METSLTTHLFPAFKEWAAIVEALGAGEQILLLRKGGIAEGRGGFQVKNQRFWLYPTFFHAQLEESKPTAAKYFEIANRLDAPLAHDGAVGAPRDASSPVTLRYFAEVVETNFVDNWSRIQALDAQHLWKESLVRERFDWSKPPGLHVIAVRVYATAEPHVVMPTAAMLGCKSWIEVPVDFDATASEPVLGEDDFARMLKSLR
ncbi:MAG TPA: DUF1802 family protein [Opitutaceae bacterium]